MAGTAGFAFQRESHGGSNNPPDYSQEPPFESKDSKSAIMAGTAGFEPANVGVKAALVGSAGAVAELKLESTILNGSIGRSGRFVLTTNEHGYRTAAAVYDTAGKEVDVYKRQGGHCGCLESSDFGKL